MRSYLTGSASSLKLTGLLCYLVVFLLSGVVYAYADQQVPLSSSERSANEAISGLERDGIYSLAPDVRRYFVRSGFSYDAVRSMPLDLFAKLPLELRKHFPDQSARLELLEDPSFRKEDPSFRKEDPSFRKEDPSFRKDEDERGAREEWQPAKAEPELSRLEKLYRDNYAAVMVEELTQFGYDIFANGFPKPSRFAVPDPSYVLGPDDRLRIRVWGGAVDSDFVGTVDRDGTINIPQIGVVTVAGIRFADVGQVIRREAEKYVQGININVALEELRSLEIYVVGPVGRPGLHMVPAFSTVIDALIASEGVSKQGSLRSIVLRRPGKPDRQIDLYELLLRGNRDSDVRLENRDVIFVPRLEQTAAVSGAVRAEGIYELTGEKKLGDLLDLAGGVLPQGFKGRIHLRRYLENREFVVEDIDTFKDTSWRETPIRDGDLLELSFALNNQPKVIRLDGHVNKPDVFRYEQGMTLRDMLSSPDLLQEDAVIDFALLHRYDSATTRYTSRRFPLELVFQGLFNMELSPYDRVEILSRKELGIQEAIAVHGAVWNPGEFIFMPGLTVADAIALAGGGKFGAELDRVELSRQEISGDVVNTTIRTLDQAAQKELSLQPYDYIMVPRVKDATLFKTVTISGEVAFPGIYRISDGEKISDLISRAGGTLPSAYHFGARYTSRESRRMQEQALENLARELDLRAQTVLQGQAQTAVSQEDVAMAKAGQAVVQNLINRIRAIEPDGRVGIVFADQETLRGSIHDFELEHGDTLHIPARPNFVSVSGSVFSPGSYLHAPNRQISYYLEKSGGPSKSADVKNMYILRANGEVISAAQSGRFTNRFSSQIVMPGDKLVVPEDLERVPYLRLVRDMTDIVFKIATTVGVTMAIL